MPNTHVSGLVALLGLAYKHRTVFHDTAEERAARDAAVKAETARIIADMRDGRYSAGGSNSEYLNRQSLRGTRQDATVPNGGAR